MRPDRLGRTARRAGWWLAALGAAVLGAGVPPAAAKVIYLSVGEDDLKRDATRSAETIKPFLKDTDSVITATDINGDGIIERIDSARKALKAGDVFLFHYSGHGRTQGDTAPLDEPEDPKKGVPPEGIIGQIRRDGSIPFAARDDDLAAALAKFAASVAIFTAFDTCFAGEMVDGTADIKRGVVFGSSGVDVCAPGDSVFTDSWFRALAADGKGSIKADKNGNGALTLGELTDFMKADIDIPLNPIRSRPFVQSFESAEHLARVIASDIKTPVPAGPPAALLLAGVGALAALGRLARRAAGRRGASDQERPKAPR